MVIGDGSDILSAAFTSLESSLGSVGGKSPHITNVTVICFSLARVDSIRMLLVISKVRFPPEGIVNLTRKMKSIAEVWRRKMLMGHGKWGDTYGYATRFAPVTSFHV
jgi:hypothetical protein